MVGLNPIVKVVDVPLHVFLANDNKLFGKIYSSDAFYLRESAAKAYKFAVELFKSQGYDLVGVDAFRPLGLQRILQESSGTSEKYVKTADTSNHPKGLAVDVLLMKNGKPVEFQSALGTWGPASDAYATEGISEEALSNRTLLQEKMVAAGFAIYGPEWWHFDFPGEEESSDERPDGIPDSSRDEAIREFYLKNLRIKE